TKVAMPSTWTYFSGTKRAYPLRSRSVKVSAVSRRGVGEKLALHGGAKLRAKPWPTWPEHGEPERAALVRVLESGSWGGFPSPNTEARAFGQEFARFVGAEHAVPCANGTFALTLALQAARVPPGSEVITSAYTFVGTAGGGPPGARAPRPAPRPPAPCL